MLEIIREGIRSCVQTGVAAASVAAYLVIAPHVHAVGMRFIKSFIYPMRENREGLQCVDHSAVISMPKSQQRAKQVVLATSSAIMYGVSATVVTLPTIALPFSEEFTGPGDLMLKGVALGLSIAFVLAHIGVGFFAGLEEADNTKCERCALINVTRIPRAVRGRT